MLFFHIRFLIVVMMIGIPIGEWNEVLVINQDVIDVRVTIADENGVWIVIILDFFSKKQVLYSSCCNSTRKNDVFTGIHVIWVLIVWRSHKTPFLRIICSEIIAFSHDKYRISQMCCLVCVIVGTFVYFDIVFLEIIFGYSSMLVMEKEAVNGLQWFVGIKG